MKQKIVVGLFAWMSILSAHPCFCMKQDDKPPAIPEQVRTALFCCQNEPVIKYYAENPGRINETLPDNVTPLTRALACRNIKLTRWLLAHGADPNLIPSGTSSTPLTLIAYKRHIKKKDIKFIRLLLRHKANINARNSCQETALMVAAQNTASANFIVFLSNQGADPTLKNSLKNDTFYLGININQLPHMKRFFNEWAEHQKKLSILLGESTPVAIDVWKLICSYLVNEFPSKPEKDTESTIKSMIVKNDTLQSFF